MNLNTFISMLFLVPVAWFIAILPCSAGPVAASLSKVHRSKSGASLGHGLRKRLALKSTVPNARCPSGKPSKLPPLDLPWFVNDDFNAFYTINISVGTPPQLMQAALDTGSSDVGLHATDDQTYLTACAAQTPTSTCFGVCKWGLIFDRVDSSSGRFVRANLDDSLSS